MDELIDIDLQLLLIRYGRPKVLKALARVVEQTPLEIEGKLRVLQQKTSAKKDIVPSKSLLEIVQQEYGGLVDDGESLRNLAVAFENRVFLPNLRDVHRFLERAGSLSVKHKSRASAGPDLFKVLSKLSSAELDDIASHNKSGGESDYSLLSKAIMGRTPAGDKKS